MLLQLGVRHAGYGVQPAHYDTVGAALLDTLQADLGAAFTPELREAWTAMYTSLPPPCNEVRLPWHRRLCQALGSRCRKRRAALPGAPWPASL